MRVNTDCGCEDAPCCGCGSDVLTGIDAIDNELDRMFDDVSDVAVLDADDDLDVDAEDRLTTWADNILADADALLDNQFCPE